MTSPQTSITAPPYHVQSTALKLRDGFPYFSYHESVSLLWSDKWRGPCKKGIYPFTDALVQDFDPIFAELVQASGDDPAILSQPDTYAAHFFPVAEKLVAQAEAAEQDGDISAARGFFLRAAAVYRIARFPINRSPVSQQAWERGKDAYQRGALYLNPPSVAIDIPFTLADSAAGDREVPIQTYLRKPKGQAPKDGWPVLLFICGLDAYKTDNTSRIQDHIDHGFATIIFEIPGTGDCPAAPNDPTSPDRLMSSILAWVESTSSEHSFNVSKVFARGISTGGYYAMRVAHTHSEQLCGVVSQGGACHHMFDALWIGAQNQMDYPFALADALAYKFGFRSSNPLQAYAAEARKFSLLETGVLDQPSCRLLLVNGMEDSIFPIEDNFIVATRGMNKDLLARGNRGHMGDPGAQPILYQWLDDVLQGKP